MTEPKKSNLYTRTGDSGTTSLVGGSRTTKHSPRLEAYGTVDELNSHIGLLISHMPSNRDFAPIAHSLLKVQHRLFDIGAALATPTGPGEEPANGVTDSAITELEHEIDRIDSQLPPLNRFVLPGGTIAASQAHVARTVCRRAERRTLSLATDTPVAPEILRYLNRLSDYLFAIARFNNVKTSSTEIFWDKDC
ncbi:MAG: cob(I)yrinic acid a,c-diamide adenosyltransferase [Bacteroides sp.]|nr:cob(I)yrinic acid a,c-diamide adenosyltransferase [Bacteroides sp.]MBD5375511.1 cob(I)yrinic acid a,c-diamide adenosyltransferase [Bacteroides sp.]